MKKSSKGKQQQKLRVDPMAAGIKLPSKAHVPLVRCRVQLLGRAAPTESRNGVVAMQKPLHELYADASTVPSVITAHTSGIVIRTPADVNAGADELWFPIQDLLECGAMRPVGGSPPTAFVPLSDEAAQRESGREALFAFVMKRRDIPTADCWAVICKSDQAAMALLTACMMAHKNPAGWATSANDRPPSTITNTERMSWQPPSEEWDGAAAKEAAQWSNKYPQDYYEKPPLQGFYYTPQQNLIQRYSISELNPEPDLDAEAQQALEQWRQRMLAADDYCPSEISDFPAPKGPSKYVGDKDSYRFPPGTQGTVVPESLLFPDAYASSDSDAHHGKERHGKKKKSKKSKHKKEKKSHKENKYNYYTEDGWMVVPQDAVTVHRAPPADSSDEEPFESRLPQPVAGQAHFVANEEYDPAWHYQMKSYIRDQERVAGFTDPVVGRPYESHIDAHLPPVDYATSDLQSAYSDNGLYERRLPVSNGKKGNKSDHKMLNRNFIMRQSEDYRRHP